MAVAIAYAEEAIEDTRREWACRWIRLAARRFLRDLQRALSKRPSFVFSARQANRYCQFIEQLPHIEGQWITSTIRLEPSQVFFLVQLFGFRNHDGGRRFTEALYCVARKNAKSTLAAAILIACMCLEPEMGAQVISAATTGSQARIVWKIAKEMIDKTPALREAFDVETFANSVLRHETSATLKPINSKASTQDGLNPSHVNTDEIHAHKSPDLINVLRSAAGARKNPLWLYTTTEGYENPGPWSEIRTFAQQILQRVLRADHFLALIYCLDDEDSEFDEHRWIKANPLLEVNPILRDEIRKLAISAQAMPSVHSEFKIKRCNRQSSTARGWVNLSKFMKCNGPVDLKALEGAPCWGAFDLSYTNDMTSWWLLWLLDGVFYTWGRYWVPQNAVLLRSERRVVPYQQWVEQGLVTVCDGEIIDYNIVARDILEDWGRFAPRKIGYDPWNATSVATNLAAEGLPLEQFIQGPKSYHPAMQAFERSYLSGTLRHGGHPVLRWNMANLVDRRDPNMNMAPDKKKSADKIDGAQCVIMAFGMAEVDDTASFDEYLSNIVSV